MSMVTDLKELLPRPQPSVDSDGKTSELDTDDIDFVSCLLAELLGSFFVIFVGLGTMYASAVVTFDVVTTDRLLMSYLAYGMAYGAVIYAFSYPAGDSRHVPNVRHINPAITMVLILTGRFSIGKTILYLMAQVTGACLAVLSIFYCTPFQKRDITTAYPLADGVLPYHQWVMELIVSSISIFFIVMVNFSAVVWQKQPPVTSAVTESAAPTNHELNCVVTGAIVFVCSLVAAPISGGFMNPLFPLGIGILSNNYQVAALVCPLIAAPIALLFGLIFGFKIDWGIKKAFQREPEQYGSMP